MDVMGGNWEKVQVIFTLPPATGLSACLRSSMPPNFRLWNDAEPIRHCEIDRDNVLLPSPNIYRRFPSGAPYQTPSLLWPPTT